MKDVSRNIRTGFWVIVGAPPLILAWRSLGGRVTLTYPLALFSVFYRLSLFLIFLSLFFH